MNLWALLGCVWIGAAAFMTVAWVVARRIGRVGIVDAFWAFGVGASAIAASAAGSGLAARRILIGAIAAAWSLRLGIMLTRRVLASSEDGRYAAMMEAFGAAAWSKAFPFFQIQAFWIALFAAPAAAASNNASALGAWDVAGALIGAGAIIGESIADEQLRRFRARPEHRGRTCRAGLWSWSRHPNYFFEWIHWWAYAALGAGAPFWWVCLSGPIVMFVFLYRVTGIPWTEKQALRSRGEDYRRYQRETSAFVPLPPRRPEP